MKRTKRKTRKQKQALSYADVHSLPGQLPLPFPTVGEVEMKHMFLREERTILSGATGTVSKEKDRG